MSVLPGAERYSHAGAAVGVLLCHGFTGTPQSLRGWGEQLAAAGYSVELPLLPGHGTTWQEMNRSTWHDWYGEVDAALTTLRVRCSTVFLGGLSMGACLALRLAVEHGHAISGLVLVNPAVKVEDPRLLLLPVLRRITGSFPGIGSDIKKSGPVELAYDRTPLNALSSMLQMYAEVRPRLTSIDQPLLVLRSAIDHVVPASSTRLILGSVSSADCTEIVLEDSYHVATLDNDAERIVKESLAFIGRLSGGEQR
ncbi:MAG TPA: alpha/beta fold hydrolase [Kineosporiaceae bacterium]|nr:alpha/beta fold hydrolase [Kineosporiaceae bacterium]